MIRRVAVIVPAADEEQRIGGTVLPGPALGPGAGADWVSRHHLREGHPHVHGANLGIRGDAYLALGGWPPMVTGEDVELAGRAARTGYLRVTRTAAIPVVTSIRQYGRAPRGFSSYRPGRWRRRRRRGHLVRVGGLPGADRVGHQLLSPGQVPAGGLAVIQAGRNEQVRAERLLAGRGPAGLVAGRVCLSFVTASLTSAACGRPVVPRMAPVRLDARPPWRGRAQARR